MNYDGLATIAVDETGKKYYRVGEHIPNHKLSDVLGEDSELEQIGDQLPEDIKDSLVTIFFTYRSFPSGPWEYPESEWEIELSVGQYVVVQNNYKEFWKKEIQEMKSHFFDEEPDWYTRDVAEWEDFYDCDFESTQAKPVAE